MFYALVSIHLFTGSKYPKSVWFTFENKSIDTHERGIPATCIQDVRPVVQQLRSHLQVWQYAAWVCAQHPLRACAEWVLRPASSVALVPPSPCPLHIYPNPRVQGIWAAYLYYVVRHSLSVECYFLAVDYECAGSSALSTQGSRVWCTGNHDQWLCLSELKSNMIGILWSYKHCFWHVNE